MLTQKSIKLSDYILYPFQIPNINLDFNVGKEEVVVQSRMIIKPILKYGITFSFAIEVEIKQPNKAIIIICTIFLKFIF